MIICSIVIAGIACLCLYRALMLAVRVSDLERENDKMRRRIAILERDLKSQLDNAK